jgi:hypothetical protein
MDAQYQSQAGLKLLSQEQLEKIRASLPRGAQVVGGVVVSDARRAALSPRSAPCVIIIWGPEDDHTIHRSEMCQTGPHDYEIISDVVVGTW